MDVRRSRPQERLALSLFFGWLVSIAGMYWFVSWWRPSHLWTVMLFIYVIVGGYGCITLLYERYKRLVLLSPTLRNHWRRLRRAFKPKRLQADMLRTRAVGVGEIGDFQLDLRVLANGEAIEIHADAIPGPPISIPWSHLEYFRTMSRDDGRELRAHFRVRQFPRMPIVVPWLPEFSQVAPKAAS
jgi:hypothetical protein